MFQSLSFVSFQETLTRCFLGGGGCYYVSEVNLQGEPDALQVLCGWPRLERERGCLFVVNSVVMELLKCTLMVEMKSRHSRHNMLTGLP